MGGGGDGHRVMNKCIHNERQTLLHFKASLEDPHDSLNTWGGEEDDCCKWSGVTCNSHTGHVTKLELFSYYGEFSAVRGEISPSLLNLTYLNHLDLSHNQFYGTIPTFIRSMTRLRYLDLSGNSFTGIIPDSIGFLTGLWQLDLAENNLTGPIPNFIGSLTELTSLNLSCNNLNGPIPRSIGSLSKLWILDLSQNSFIGTIPNTIGSLTELTFLDLSSNFYHGVIPSKFGNLTNLEETSIEKLGRCRIENIDWLSHLSHLQSIDLSGISLAKANHWVNAILSLQNLSVLYLENCDLSHVMYPYSSSFLNSSSFSSSIATLYLGNNNLNSSMYSWLFPLTSNSLRYLNLGSNVLDGIPKYLGNSCNLTSLILYNNSEVVTFPDFLKNLSSGCASVGLQELDVSSSQFTGSVSDDIQKFSYLVNLDLSENQLNGTVSEKVWELPQLNKLYASSNSFQEFTSKIHMSNLSNVMFVDLSSCKLGPHFPKWIQPLKKLERLDISNNGISDRIPVEFWSTWPIGLTYLNLSSNHIDGKASDLLSIFFIFGSVIDLSSNNFYGPIENVSSSLLSLNLSRNKFYGGLSFLCQIEEGFISFLDLSHNSFTGQLPDCLWHFKQLTILNLGDNNLYGRLPASLGYLVSLEVLYLYNNSFSGELPRSLQNCTVLSLLNFGANKFYGNVPVWIGENLPMLYSLSLRSNNFFGTIPLQLCQLVHLQVLDLSRNNLSGSIPTCLNNLTLLVREGFSQNIHSYSLVGDAARRIAFSDRPSGLYVDESTIEWHGNDREFTSNLRFLKSIDMSSNNLTGQIPKELTDLHELLALNLSKNALLGEIPQTIGNMKKLLSLDLSRNKLSGGLPSTMSEMTSLDYLDVSYNNLSGRIPSSTQLQTFEPSRYTGNTRLCGPPLTKYCPGDKESELPLVRSADESNEEGKDELERWFYIGMAIGFAIGFWLACGVLLLNRPGRRFFFHFLESSKDWIYVKVMVFISK